MRLGRLAAAPPVAALLALALVATLTTVADARDSRWVFYTKDKTYYTSPWFQGAHRIMIAFGCTRAPYYSPDPRCRDDRGFHHGDNPVLLRNRKRGFDLVIGHTRKVYVRPGDLVKRGTMFARANDRGAPDGCHLHFERRAVKGGLSTAVKPRGLLALTPRERS